MPLLAMAMILAGAVSTGDAQRRGPAPPARSAQRARPMHPLGSYFTADDYPAMEDGIQEGIVGFRLTIGPNGRVSDCAIARSSGSQPLDHATCRILRTRARYTAARDSAGNPTIGTDSGSVRWRHPEEAEAPADRRAGIPIPFTPAERRAPLQSYVPARDHPAAPSGRAVGISSVRLVIGMTGRVIACDVVEDRGATAPHGGAAACRAARARARYTPARSRAGGYVCDVAFEDVLWRLAPRRPADAAAPPPIAQQLAPGTCPGRTP